MFFIDFNRLGIECQFSKIRGFGTLLKAIPFEAPQGFLPRNDSTYISGHASELWHCSTLQLVLELGNGEVC